MPLTCNNNSKYRHMHTCILVYSVSHLERISVYILVRSCNYEGSSNSNSQSIKMMFKDGVPVNYSVPKCFTDRNHLMKMRR